MNFTNPFTRKSKKIVDGSLSTPAFNVREEIFKLERELAEATAVAAVGQTPGWSIIVERLKTNIESSAMNVIALSGDPTKNQNLIIAEGAKRERDLALINFVAEAISLVPQLTARIEELNQTLQRRALQEDTPHYGPERKVS